uniref:Uncharacterized protein n=1 Tax=Hyaloperonospora arabidopsidis (strain Emoy2) TaxID=559515 RepID=M4BLK4_HYAAE
MDTGKSTHGFDPDSRSLCYSVHDGLHRVVNFWYQFTLHEGEHGTARNPLTRASWVPFPLIPMDEPCRIGHKKFLTQAKAAYL